MPSQPRRGEAYTAVRHVYDKSPGRSWRRLNAALGSALDAAITAHLSFEEGDFRAIYSDMNGGYWMGNGSGGACGERFYNLAVLVGHTPACISFESYAGRPPILWPEEVKTPERLTIGSRFTWEGLSVEVTSLTSKQLVACSYGQRHFDPALEPGSILHFHGESRPVEQVCQMESGALFLRFGPPVPSPTRQPDRVLKITYAELAAKRKAQDAVRRSILREIAELGTVEALTALRRRLSSAPLNTFRHFDIEDFRRGLAERENTFDQRKVEVERERDRREELKRWMAGDLTHGYFNEVRLRIKGDYVETSTGHSVAVSSARALLPLLAKCRGQVVDVQRRIDIHTVRQLNREGVLIGCTLIPWAEVDRITPALESVGSTNPPPATTALPDQHGPEAEGRTNP